MNQDPNFNIYTFFNWFNKQDVQDVVMDKPLAPIPQQESNKHVVSRLGVERLEKQIRQHNQLSVSEAKQIAMDFDRNGGFLIETIDLDAVVIVEDKKFKIPKSYIKFSES